jgi:drug/metabolite transporter (DMT)-like permease
VLPEARAVLLLVAVAVAWGSVGVFVREIGLPAVVIVAFRAGLAAAALGAWLGRRPSRLPGEPFLRHRPARTLLNGVVLAVHWVTFIAALQRAPIGNVLLVIYLAPVGIAVLAPRVLGERVPLRTVVALALAVAGVALVASQTATADADGLWFAAASSVLYVWLALLNKPLASAYGGGRLAFTQLLVAAVVLAPFALVADAGSPSWSWGWLLVLGLGHTALCVAVYLTALERLPATRAAVLLYLEPVSAIAFGWLLLDESPTVATAAGGALVVLAGVLVARPSTVDAVPAPSQPEVAGVPR